MLQPSRWERFVEAVAARNHIAVIDRGRWNDPEVLKARRIALANLRLYADAAGLAMDEATRRVQAVSERQLYWMGY